MPLLLALLLLAAGPVHADSFAFRLSTGRVISLPAIETLSCKAMRAVLDAIDRTGYRRGGPEPADAADMALLEYEDRLSRSFYVECVRRPIEALPPSAGFGAEARGRDGR